MTRLQPPRAVRREHTSGGEVGQFNLRAFLLASTIAPPVFGLYAGVFGSEMQVMAVLIGFALLALAAYLAVAVVALLAVYYVPLTLWRLCTLVASRPQEVASSQHPG